MNPVFDDKIDITEQLPARVKAVKPFLAMEIMQKAQQMEADGVDVIRMEVGEPGGETPSAIKNAVIEAVQNNDTGYTHSLGKPKLREEIVKYYKRTYNVDLEPEQVLVASGSSPAMLLAFSALLESGDRLIVSDPYYACYPNFVRYLGAEPLLVPVKEEDAFKLRASDVKKYLTDQVKGVLINSPANPTGAVLGERELEEFADLDTYIISDEIYHGINYIGRDRSILEFTDKSIVINGFSKRNIMTGWRLGYMIGPRELVNSIQKLQQNLFICACAFVQAAGIAALQESTDILEKRFSGYNERRLYLYDFLKKIGIAPAKPPDGAFYMLANVKKYTSDSLSFAHRILEETKVAVTPGIDFGPGAEGYIRISYACSMETLKEGLTRLEKFFADLDSSQ
ncbi:MAG: pyridoxal phosphate-dependent aminotransferase [Bacillota bacterium]|nr:pyridoxal phosphate-dependent aminotransferase [Bacillota bacterium]